MNRGIMSELNARLLPCPFCGGGARVEVSRAYVGGVSTRAGMAYCPKCHSRSAKFDTRYSKTHIEACEKAINAWNKRAIER